MSLTEQLIFPILHGPSKKGSQQGGGSHQPDKGGGQFGLVVLELGGKGLEHLKKKCKLAIFYKGMLWSHQKT